MRGSMDELLNPSYLEDVIWDTGKNGLLQYIIEKNLFRSKAAAPSMIYSF